VPDIFLPKAFSVAALVVVVGAAAAVARADSAKPDCLDTNAKAQDARRAHHFAAARTLLQQCSVSSCPDLVRDDCSKRLDELDRAQPTIVFSVTDATGKDLVAVKVSVDGNVLTDKVDGTALNVDPGAREFTFEVAGQPPAKRTFVIREGEKERAEKVILGDAASTEGAPAVRHIAKLVVSTEAAATIAVDGTTVATGRFDGQLAPGPHAVDVTEPGKIAYSTQVDLHDGEARTLDVTLASEKKAPLWPWLVAGGAVVVGAAVGGYFLFKPQETQHAPLTGTLGTVRFTAWP
jgi:hypothetical protein